MRMEFLAYSDGTIREPLYRPVEEEPTTGPLKNNRAYQSVHNQTSNRYFTSGPRDHIGDEKEERSFTYTPKDITFKDFEVGNAYEVKLILTNATTKFKAFRVVPINPKFSHELSFDYTVPSRIAAGLRWPVVVKFRPTRNEDINTVLRIRTDTGSFTIPIKARKKCAEITVEETLLDFGTLIIGECQKKYITLRNSGALSGTVQISGSFKKFVEKMHVDPVNKDEHIYFTINPLVYRVDMEPFSTKQFEVSFNPFEECEVDCEVELMNRQEGVDRMNIVSIRGKSTALPVHVSSSDINFSWCFFGSRYTDQIIVANHSSVSAIVKPTTSPHLKDVIRFEPEVVCVQAGTEFPIIVSFVPKTDLDVNFETVISLHIKGQALSATVKLSALLTIREPHVNVTTLNFGKTHMNQEKMQVVEVTNQSDLPQLLGFLDIPDNITIIPQTMTMLPKETLSFEVCVAPPFLGTFSQHLYLCNEYGDSVDMSVYGSGVNSPLAFAENHICLPPCPLGGTVAASTVLTNQSNETKQFLFKVDGEFIRVSPSSGALTPGESMPIVLFFTAPPEFIYSIVQHDLESSQLSATRRRKKSSVKALAQATQQTSEVETIVTFSYETWEKGKTDSWSQHKTVYVKCQCDWGGLDDCFMRVDCVVVRGDVLGRTILSLHNAHNQKEAAPNRKKTMKIAKKGEAELQNDHTEVIEVSPLRCCLLLDFGETSLNHSNIHTCFIRNNGVVPTHLQVRPIDPLSPFTILRPPNTLLRPQEEEAILVSFKPTEYGAYHDVFVISSSTANDVEINLRGECCCTDLVVSLDAQVDVDATERNSLSAIAFSPCMLGGMARVPVFFHNFGTSPLEVSIHLPEELATDNWVLRRTFMFYPSTFSVPPKGKTNVTAHFCPQQTGNHFINAFAKAGGFEQKLSLTGRGCNMPIYCVLPQKEDNCAMIEGQSFSSICDGVSADFPFQVYFQKGETKSILLGSVKGGPNAECIVEKWDDAFTASGWSLGMAKVPILSGTHTTLSITLSGDERTVEKFVPYCKFQILIKCLADQTNERTIHICCTGP